MKIYAVEDRHLENLNVSLNNAPFNSIFQDKWRIVVPIKNVNLEEIIGKLQNGETKSGKKYIVDFYAQEASVEGDKRKFRLGKVIQKELGEEFANEYSRQVDYDTKNGYITIISRHPYDIIRMSDFKDITSCHSPKGDYFADAIQEAEDGGAIAYAIKKNDYNLIKDHLQDDDLFYDPDRKVGTKIQPVSRTRLNRYTDSEDNEILIPIPRTYGQNIGGFYNSVANWAKQVQEDVDYRNVDLRDFTRHGGDYADFVNDSYLFNTFFNTTIFYGNAKHGYREDTDSYQLFQQEINRILTVNNSLDYFKIYAYIEDMDAEYSSITCDIEFNYTFDNISIKIFEKYNQEDKLDENINDLLKQNNYEVSRIANIRRKIGVAFADTFGDYYNWDTNYTLNIVDSKLKFTALQSNSLENPDDIPKHEIQHSDNNVDAFVNLCNAIFFEENLVSKENKDLLYDFNFAEYENIDIDFNEEKSEFEVFFTFPILIPMKIMNYEFRESVFNFNYISNKLFEKIKEIILKIYNNNYNDLLFEFERDKIEISKFPEVYLRILDLSKFNENYMKAILTVKLIIDYTYLNQSVNPKGVKLFFKYLDDYYDTINLNIFNLSNELFNAEVQKQTKHEQDILGKNSWYDKTLIFQKIGKNL